MMNEMILYSMRAACMVMGRRMNEKLDDSLTTERADGRLMPM